MPHTNHTPSITQLRVIPVAGRDSMLLNLSGAHGPFFTRNLLILTDNAGRTGVGEVPGGEKIRQTREDARAWVEGQSIGNAKNLLNRLQQKFADRRGKRAELLVNHKRFRAAFDFLLLRELCGEDLQGLGRGPDRDGP